MCPINLLLILFFIILIFHIGNKINKNTQFKHQCITLRPSNIHGNGLFSNIDYKPNDYVFNAVNNGCFITPIGSKINHSWNPNTYLKRDLLKYNVYAKKYIPSNTELTIDYRYSPFFIQKPPNHYI